MAQAAEQAKKGVTRAVDFAQSDEVKNAVNAGRDLATSAGKLAVAASSAAAQSETAQHLAKSTQDALKDVAHSDVVRRGASAVRDAAQDIKDSKAVQTGTAIAQGVVANSETLSTARDLAKVGVEAAVSSNLGKAVTEKVEEAMKGLTPPSIPEKYRSTTKLGDYIVSSNKPGESPVIAGVIKWADGSFFDLNTGKGENKDPNFKIHVVHTTKVENGSLTREFDL